MANKNPLNKLITKRQLKEDLTHILETPQGQRFFEVLLRECHVTKPVFHSDDSKLREAEGRRKRHSKPMSSRTLLRVSSST